MNARGVLYDYLNYNSRTLFKRWDSTGVKVATSLRGTLNNRTDTDTGWSLEAAIPWVNFEELSRRPPGRSGLEGELQPVGRRRTGPSHEHLVRSRTRRRGRTCRRGSARSCSLNRPKEIGGNCRRVTPAARPTGECKRSSSPEPVRPPTSSDRNHGPRQVKSGCDQAARILVVPT